MKKILSIFTILAIVFSFAVAASAAVEVNVSVGTAGEFDASKIEDDTYFTIPVYFDALPASTNGSISAFSIDLEFDPKVFAPSVNGKGSPNFWTAVQQYYDWNEEGLTAASGYKVSVTSVDENSSLMTILFASPDMNTYCFESKYGFDPSVAMGTIKIKKVAGAKGSSEIRIKKVVIVDTESTQVTGASIGFNDCTVFLGEAAPSVNTVNFAEDVENNRVVVTSDGTDTDWQIGSGVAITVNTDVSFTKMIWALTIDGVRKFSEPIEFDTPTIAGNLQFAATFINGGHNDKFAVNAPDPAEIRDVDAIFADEADVEYFTNATDAEPEYRR